MVHINLICVGKIKEKFFKEAIEEYAKRLSRFCNLNIFEVPDEKIPEKTNINIENLIKQKEGKAILNNIKNDNYVVALDLKGEEMDSIDFSKEIEKISNINSTISFIIGGSLGLSEEVLGRSNRRICFSKMTFPHQLMRIFLLEQIYRAFKISNNEKYHK